MELKVLSPYRVHLIFGVVLNSFMFLDTHAQLLSLDPDQFMEYEEADLLQRSMKGRGYFNGTIRRIYPKMDVTYPLAGDLHFYVADCGALGSRFFSSHGDCSAGVFIGFL